MPKECTFCPSTATQTGEHLWSDWINGILPKSTYTFKRVETRTQKESTWSGEELNLKARVVCGKCNHGWMSDIEKNEGKPALSPLIRDTSPKVLPIRILISIGIFLFKTAVIADHASTGNSPFFTIEERYRFRKTLCIPPGLSMWIGALEDSFRGTFKALHVVPVAATENDFGLYVFTYVVGHLVLQLVGAKWATHNPRVILPPKHRDSDSDYVIWFWPIAGSIRWPPPKYVPMRLLDNVTDRWKTYNAT
jgi:hypothetical protein